MYSDTVAWTLKGVGDSFSQEVFAPAYRCSLSAGARTG
jgi:hypothetical protein